MRYHLRPLSWTITALIAVMSAASCDSDSRVTAPPPPALPFVISVEILGPDTIPPGTTARFSVRGKWSTGEVREILNGVTWQSSNQAVLAIDPSGTATAREKGIATIKASMTGTPGATVVVNVP